jgi:hypothetical protein
LPMSSSHFLKHFSLFHFLFLPRLSCAACCNIIWELPNFSVKFFTIWCWGDLLLFHRSTECYCHINVLLSRSRYDSRTALGPTQPPIQWVPEALSLAVKRPGHEAHHSPPTSAEVKEWVELYLHSPIRLHGVVIS